MSDRRFWFVIDNGKLEYVQDNITGEKITVTELEDLLNEQQSTITSLKERNKQLRRRLEKINGGYGHLTHRNGLTANEWVIESQEKELIKKNKQISDWIEQHSKDIVKIGEQQSTISQLQDLCGKSDYENAKLRIKNKKLKKENEQLKADEKLYAKEILRLKEELKEKEIVKLGSDY